MKSRNIYWLIAGFLNLFTFFLHLIGGQISLINPMLESNLDMQVKSEMLGVWHMASVVLLGATSLLLYFGFRRKQNPNTEIMKVLGYMYILFSIGFVGASLYTGKLAPQWILLLPIGALTLIGINKNK